MWDLPRPGIKPVSPALAGGFLTTVPPGKSPLALLSAISLGEWWGHRGDVHFFTEQYGIVKVIGGKIF